MGFSFIKTRLIIDFVENWDQKKHPPPQIDQVKILHSSFQYKINLLSAACKMLDSDWQKIPNLEPS